jgi:hypothetical protein
MDTVTEARAIFQSLDKNGDGTLDLIELYDGLSDFGLTDAQIQTIFFDLDANSDGQVSEEEFLTGYATLYPHKQGNTNHSGQTGADRDVEPSPADAVVSVAEKQADAAPVKEEAPSVEKEVDTDQQLAANETLPPLVEWAADLPEGAFAEFESRAFIIPKGEHRATKLSQLRSLATLVKQVLEIRDLTDDNKHSDTHGKMITWPMVNMYACRSCVCAVLIILLCVRCAYDLGLFQVPHM